MGAKDSCHTTSGYHKDEVGGLIDTQFMHLFIYGCVHIQCVCICKDVRFYGCDLLATDAQGDHGREQWGLLGMMWLGE